MTKKQGNALKPGIYRIWWKSGGWKYGVIGDAYNHLKEGRCGFTLSNGLDRDVMCPNWSGSLKGSRIWRKIARVERLKLPKMPGEPK